MQLKPIFFVVLAALGALWPQSASAQEVLLNDADCPVVRGKAPQVIHHRTKGIAAAPFPFFEDFSTGILDTNKWAALPELDARVPTIGRNRALNPPSRGALTFDGATYTREKYANALETNYQDVLVSQDIDLSGLNVSNDVYFTFFYQPGGNNDAPESFDSLILSFDTTGAGDYVRVWSAIGDGAPDSRFTQVHFPLLETYFFHPSFRFKFESYGSMNGELDVWHLDYIYFAANRGPDDTLFTDISPTDLEGSPLGAYTAVPRDHYQLGGYAASIEAQVGKASGTSQSGSIALNLSDPVGGNPINGNSSQSLATGAVIPYVNQDIPVPAFSDQSAGWTNYGTLRVSARTTSGGDTRTVNDTLHVDYRIDTLLGYDDGQPDGGYGLTYARSFCQEYRIPERDTISAVWIAFSPTMHYNFVTSQSTCLNGATFKLTLWDTLAPDSFTTQQGTGMIIDYGETEGYWQRFTFINPQIVDTVFWLGIRQNDNKPLGIGFDKQAVEARVYYEDALAEFSRTSLTGGLMIRPEFANINEPVGTLEPQAEPLSQLLIYPQPWQEGTLTARLKGQVIRSGTWRIYDLQGRLVRQGNVSTPSREFELAGVDVLDRGMYIFELQGIGTEGKTIRHRQRLLVAE